ncbi:shikimate kinase [Paroceanicella profunda]|uniref:Shikimate kinase n=1 Tax=Paroceanicella profunda TaxID=2579971 RepID=A0A5B8G2R4_9RHOB|nr:shikimate kinase [Paroceanicella profunda]QDL92913.1 shikimate kinase [Paroceanicella profunda]
MTQMPSPGPETGHAPGLRRTLVLVGIMGAGKSSVGQVLADRLGAPFTDSDHEIEAAAGMSVQEIFQHFGEPYFRAGETRVIDRLLTGTPRVLATGGGAFIQPPTRALIRAKGVSLWLRVSLDVVFERIKGKPGRPLLAGADPRGALGRLMALRDPIYAEADMVVDSLGGEGHQQAASRILAHLAARDATLPPEARLLKERPAE